MAALLALTSSRPSGFLLWGMRELPVASASPSFTNPNSSVQNKSTSSASRERWVPVSEHQNTNSTISMYIILHLHTSFNLHELAIFSVIIPGIIYLEKLLFWSNKENCQIYSMCRRLSLHISHIITLLFNTILQEFVVNKIMCLCDFFLSPLVLLQI